MKRILSIIVILITLIVVTLYFLDALEYNEDDIDFALEAIVNCIILDGCGNGNIVYTH